MKLNPLMIIAIVFAASFSGRAISFAVASSHAMSDSKEKTAHAGDAPLADEDPKEIQHAEAAIAAAVQETAAQAGEANAANLPDELAPKLPDADQDEMLAAIRERSATLDKREAAIAERERLLEVIEKRVEEKTVALAAVKDELEGRLSFAETAAEQDISQLARMYEAMKPKRAGEIFNAMEPAFAAGFLTQMNADSAALVLANMETEKAYAASIIIAGRNASVKR